MTSASSRKGYTVELVALAACALVAGAVWFLFFRAPKQRNVILISIDSLRYDHLGCYGYRSVTGEPNSPNLDRLARDGARFETVHSSTSWTLPAHFALMTGCPDQIHGVRHDTVASDPARPMLAERFLRAGYATAGFFGGTYLDPHFGFGRGFSRYVNEGAATPYGKDSSAIALQTMEIESHRVRTAEAIERDAEAFLEGRRGQDQPFFLFLHHWDVHYDYNAPEAYVQKFTIPGSRLSMNNFMGNAAIHKGMPDEDYRYLLGCYDAEIYSVDVQIGRLLAKLDELGMRDDTYVVVVSDHGEEFFEHDGKGHRQTLNEEVLRIPWIIAGPDVRKGLTIDTHARMVDVAPTVLDLVGLPADREIFGTSLKPLLDGGRVPDALRELPLTAELIYVPRSAGSNEPSPYLLETTAAGSGPYKLIETVKRRYDGHGQNAARFDGELIESYEPQLYDLAKDPQEREDLAASRPDDCRRLEEFSLRIEDTLRRLAVPGQVAVPMPDAVAEHLKEGHYLGSNEEVTRLREERLKVRKPRPAQGN